jgi:hypothetical protein
MAMDETSQITLWNITNYTPQHYKQTSTNTLIELTGAPPPSRSFCMPLSSPENHHPRAASACLWARQSTTFLSPPPTSLEWCRPHTTSELTGALPHVVLLAAHRSAARGEAKRVWGGRGGRVPARYGACVTEGPQRRAARRCWWKLGGHRERSAIGMGKRITMCRGL